MNDIIGGLKYDIGTAKLLADNEFSDGTNRLYNGRSAALYRTGKGRYFMVNTTIWEGESDHITPLDNEEARTAFESMNNRHETYTDAGFAFEDA